MKIKYLIRGVNRLNILFFPNTQPIKNFPGHIANESISEVPWIFLWTLSNLKWRMQSTPSLNIYEKPYPENQNIEGDTDNNFQWFTKTKHKPFQVTCSDLVWKRFPVLHEIGLTLINASQSVTLNLQNNNTKKQKQKKTPKNKSMKEVTLISETDNTRTFLWVTRPPP